MIDRLIHIVYPYPVCCHSIFLFGVASQQNLLFLSIFGLYKSSVFRRETATSWAFYGTVFFASFLAGFSISCESLAIAGLICGDQDGGGAIGWLSRNGELSYWYPNIRYIFIYCNLVTMIYIYIYIYL